MSRFTFATSPFVIAGPCVVEAPAVMDRIADELANLSVRLSLPICFKASFDKANRASIGSARGPGIEAGLEALSRQRERTGLPILTDIHEPHQAAIVAEVVDAIQIPAFLSRQTDLLVAAGSTGLPLNIKKGQWMAPEAMTGAVEKARSGGGRDIAVTERGTFLGYGDLVVDFRNLPEMRRLAGVPVIYDATHSVQQPGRARGGASGGQRHHIPSLLRAAAAVGVEGFFLETHPDPEHALSDAATQWPLESLEALLRSALDVRDAAGGSQRGH